MKKNKSEIILIVAIAFFLIAGLYFFKESKTIVTTAEIPYEKQSSVNYKVHLNDKTYYEKEYLDEGMQYISSIIDYIDADFNYKADYKNIDSYNVNKSVIAEIKIVDPENSEKVIYSNTEVLEEERDIKDKLDINENIKIDYNKYNKLANEFKTSYGISAKCTLSIKYNLTYSSKDGVLTDADLIYLDIPLSEQMININKSAEINDKSTYFGQTTDSPINKIMFIVSYVFFAISAVGILLLMIEIKNRIKNESKYDRFISKVLREYDSYITESKEENKDIDKSIIKVNSFKELLDVRNNVEKTIVYTKINENKSKFQIIDDEIYEYEINRKEMD